MLIIGVCFTLILLFNVYGDSMQEIARIDHYGVVSLHTNFGLKFRIRRYEVKLSVDSEAMN